MEKKTQSSPDHNPSAGSFQYDPDRNPAKSKSILLQPPSVSLPKGGGSIKSIDEKFQVNSSNGTASFAIPCPLTPARNGFTPALALSYNSGSGNSSFGLGWHLDVPEIQRRTEKKYPMYDDDVDVFQFAGSEDLVPSEKPELSPNSKLYHPRTEGSFSRIEKISENGNVYWKVTDRNNTVSIFGKSPECRIAYPANPSKIFKWLLEYSYDDKGNLAYYEYAKEDLLNVPQDWLFEKNRSVGNVSNLYPKRILYGNDEMFPLQEGDPANITYRFEVAFVYGKTVDVNDPTTNGWECRVDPFSDSTSGMDIRNYRLCSRILLIHHFANELGVNDYMVKSLDLTFEESKKFTYLVSVTSRGFILKNGKYTSQAYPPLTFQYHKADFHPSIKEPEPQYLEHAPIGLDDSKYQWIDLYSEGISGILTEQAGSLFYKSNRGNGIFTAGLQVLPKPSFTGLGTGVVQVQDIASSGVKSFVVHDDHVNGYFDVNDEGDLEEFKSFRSWPNIDWKDPNLKFIDLDGDGAADILITEDQVFRWYPSKGRVGYDDPTLIRKPLDEEEGPAIVFADSSQNIVLCDLSGDGMLDIARVRNGEVCYWPSRGRGRFGKKITMTNSPVMDTPDGFNSKYLKLADIDGSGTTDIIYLGQNEFKVWFNESGNGWSAPEIIVNPFPAIDGDSKIDVVDFLGIGTSCVVWSSPLPRYASAPLKYIDLFEGRKPHVMHTYCNNLGKEITIQYRSSVQFYLDDLEAGDPWVTRLPFPTQCVEKVVVRDYISQTRFITSYSYHHGYYDSVEKEFRGFARVEQTDSEFYKDFTYGVAGAGASNETDPELFQEPVRTISWVHTGAYLRGQKILHQLANEYSDQHQHLSEPILPANLTTAELIEAHRALKGLALRQEVYSLDEQGMKKKLYTVNESNYFIQLLQQKGGNAHAVFFPFESEKVAINIEGNPADPRIAHTLNLEIDHYGMVTQSAAVVYGRKINSVHPDQQKQRVTYTSASFIHLDNRQEYFRLGLVSDKRDFELGVVSPPAKELYSIAELISAIANSTDTPYENWDAVPGSRAKRLIEYSRIRYLADDATTSLPFGTAASKGLVYETQIAAFTDSLFTDLFESNFSKSLLQSEGKYANELGFHWITSGRTKLDPSRFFQPVEVTDPFGERTKLTYDPFMLSVVKVEDPLQNVTEATMINYRLMTPLLMKDPNDNLSAVRYDELGRVIALFSIGKPATDKGDVFDSNQLELQGTDRPSVEFEYHIDEWYRQTGVAGFVKTTDKPNPNYAKKTAHEVHFLQDNAAWAKTFVSYLYSDGSGHEALTKMQAEPGDAPERGNTGILLKNPDGSVKQKSTGNALRWVGQGKTVVNNKGNPVKKYEPYFDSAPAYNDEKELRTIGITPVLYYDSVGRMVKTAHPNKTFSRVVFDNWKQEAWDENDTVMESQWYADRIAGPPGDPEKVAALKAAKHKDTPSVSHIDALGKVFLIKSSDGLNQRDITTYVRFDLEGNVRSVTDARNNTVMSWKYDMLGNMCFQHSMDAGDRWVLMNVAGNAIRKKDSRKHLLTYAYDKLQRPTTVKVEGGDGNVPLNIISDKIIYGERLVDDKKMNLRGQLAIHLDTGGKLTNERFDFKGNLLQSKRWICSDYKSIPDWSVAVPDTLLEDVDKPFITSMEYDGLNRIVKSIAPDKSETIPGYNKASLLETVEVTFSDQTGQPIITNIDYDARGRRVAIYYGNDATTSYQYDPETLRLIQLETKKANNLFQRLKYTYDPVGNITLIRDEAIPDIFFNNFKVEPQCAYEYDALYRLKSATGKEHIAQVNFGGEDNWQDLPFLKSYDPDNPMQLRGYTQNYQYDTVGNILEMAHVADGGSWTRTYEYQVQNNRLISSQVGAESYGYPHHPLHGFMTAMPHLSKMEWNFRDELRCTARQVYNDGTPESTWYVYDGQGIRIRKVTELQAGRGEVPKRKDERIYLGSYEIYRSYDANNAADFERRTLHVMDDKSRVALIEMQDDDPEEAKKLVRFQLGNHLGSVSLELDENAAVISYEEFHPFGTTAVQAVNGRIKAAAKRFRYTGVERDEEETGLEYHRARYYLPWLGRWLNSDPAGISDSLNQFLYVKSNPLSRIDRGGEAGENTVDDIFKFILNQAGFQAGGGSQAAASDWLRELSHPPSFNSGSASPFGTAAHAEATNVVEDIKGIGVRGAEDIYSEVAVSRSTGIVTKIGGSPIRGHHNLDLVHKPGGIVPNQTTLGPGSAEVVGDLKYGGKTITETHASFGERGVTVNSTFNSTPSTTPASIAEAEETLIVASSTSRATSLLAKAGEAMPTFRAAGEALAPLARTASRALGPIAIGFVVLQVLTAKTTEEKVDAGISVASTGLLLSGNPVAMVAGAGLSVGQIVSDDASEWSSSAGMSVNEGLQNLGLNKTASVVIGGAASFATIPVTAVASAGKKVGQGAVWAAKGVGGLVSDAWDYWSSF